MTAAHSGWILRVRVASPAIPRATERRVVVFVASCYTVPHKIFAAEHCTTDHHRQIHASQPLCAIRLTLAWPRRLAASTEPAREARR